VAYGSAHRNAKIDQDVASRLLQDALQISNIPTLLMVLAQLTGDERWLSDPYRPSRTRGLDDNDSGGFPEAIQREIRSAAFDVLLNSNAEQPIESLSPDRVVEMMSVCMGEPIPAEYGPMMMEELGFLSRDPQWPSPPDPAVLANFTVLIIGAGASGLCAAIKLHQLGIRYQVIEMDAAVGGTWFENRYPGSGVDTPSHLYSYSFARNDWPRYYSDGGEIHRYLERCASEFGISDHIRLNTEVVSAEYDEASRMWQVTTRSRDGAIETMRANVVISAVGQLNVPSIPAIPGAETFGGIATHSARWPDGLEIAGQRVAVIGTGASAMQIVPAIADTAAQVVVFQRSPQWAAPSPNYRRQVPEQIRYLMEQFPIYAAWYRCRLLWSFSDKIHESLQIDPEWPDQQHSINATNDAHRRSFTRHIRQQLDGRTDLLEKTIPQYPPFAKRMLLDNNWFKTLRKPNVDLVTSGINEIVPGGVLDATGALHPADVIVYATGFQTLRMIGSFDVIGRSGKSLRDVWGEDDPRAYLGITIPGFPNFFCLYGPNTSLGHGGSLILLTELGVRYISLILQQMILAGIGSVECRPDVFDEYNRRIDEAHARMIWSHTGTTNWYRNQHGRVVTNSPWRVVDYWRMTHEFNDADFVIEYEPLDQPDGAAELSAPSESGPAVRRRSAHAALPSVPLSRT
jgi:4-hydroxyacetophenone monooxygenase